MLKDNLTNRDADVIAKLRSSGAIILGKSNLSQWANFRSERSSSGWSALGGQTQNPHGENRSPCGSSSGSGAGVAAGLVTVALGTETDGSVVCPSSVNGIVGIKPTLTLVSQKGIIPIAHSQDTAGPMAKNVTDAAILLANMATDNKNHDDYLAALDQTSLKGKRLGVLRAYTGYHEGVDANFDQALIILKAAGAIIIDDIKIESYSGFGQDSYDVLLYEFKHGLNNYLKSLPNELKGLTLEKIIQFNKDHQKEELNYFQQEIFEKAQKKGPISEKKIFGRP